MSGTQKQFSRMTTIEKNKIEINSQKQMRNEVEGEGEDGRHYGVVRRFGRSLPIANKKKSCTIPKATTARGRRRRRGGEEARAFYALGLIATNVLQLFFTLFSTDLLRIPLILSNLEIERIN